MALATGLPDHQRPIGDFKFQIFFCFFLKPFVKRVPLRFQFIASIEVFGFIELAPDAPHFEDGDLVAVEDALKPNEKPFKLNKILSKPLQIIFYSV